MKINFFNQTEHPTNEYESLIKRVLGFTKTKKVFSIIFVTDEEIQRLNREFRNIDRVTDVISFALCDDPNNELVHELGDIFIDLDQAKRQAIEYGHTMTREVAFLAVHGFLHLNGYDHMTEEDEKVMFAKQDEILMKAGIFR